MVSSQTVNAGTGAELSTYHDAGISIWSPAVPCQCKDSKGRNHALDIYWGDTTAWTCPGLGLSTCTGASSIHPHNTECTYHPCTPATHLLSARRSNASRLLPFGLHGIVGQYCFPGRNGSPQLLQTPGCLTFSSRSKCENICLAHDATKTCGHNPVSLHPQTSSPD